MRQFLDFPETIVKRLFPPLKVGDGAGTAPSAVVDVEDAVRNADTEMEVGVEWGKFLL